MALVPPVLSARQIIEATGSELVDIIEAAETFTKNQP